MKCPKCDTSNPETARFCLNCASPIPSPGQAEITKTIETPMEGRRPRLPRSQRCQSETGRAQKLDNSYQGSRGFKQAENLIVMAG